MTWWGATHLSEAPLKKTPKHAYPHNMTMLQPDGIAGMLYGLDQEQIILKKRRGFCRVALQTGASLIPCYCFGANQVYNRKFGPTSFAARFSRKLKKRIIELHREQLQKYI